MFPNSKIEAIDINKIFINNCKKRNSDNSILFKHKNIIEKINEKEKYDLILFSFNGLTNILEEEEVRMALNNIYNLLKKGGKFIFTIHDMFSTEEYKNYWLEKVKVYDLELFSEKKVLSNKENDIWVKNRFYTQEDMKKILSDEFNFKILEVSKRDEKLEEEWVKKLSKPLLFYVTQK
ncbi:class I SAM-dependent methyltransferase [Mycoplasmoides gallisepticum]|nr:class I SAM-dependent methyltransferase [Mycoplasmoides gallisepticum]ULH67852.1 class I SAM-dependent methyltransferase [Mycoplasmoides gallisepticum]